MLFVRDILFLFVNPLLQVRIGEERQVYTLTNLYEICGNLILWLFLCHFHCIPYYFNFIFNPTMCKMFFPILDAFYNNFIFMVQILLTAQNNVADLVYS